MLEAFQLQLQHRGEGFKQHTLARILKGWGAEARGEERGHTQGVSLAAKVERQSEDVVKGVGIGECGV